MVYLLLGAVVVIGGAVAIGVVVIIATGLAAGKAERRRADALYAWTMASGWQLVEGDVATSWRHRLAHLSRFRIHRLAHTVVHGLPVTAADCRYESYSTDSEGHTQSSTQALTVFVARLPGRWPDLEVRNRHLGSRLMRALGRQSPIEVGHPLFDQRFRVEAADARAARALLSPALIDAHLSGRAQQWSIRGGELMITTSGRMTPGVIVPGVERLGWLAELLGYRSH